MMPEDIGVDVEFSNPLQIPIDISSICLSCEFIETAAVSIKEADDMNIDNSNLEKGNELREAASEEIDSQISKEETADISASPLFLPQEAFSLKPEEKIVVRLTVKPLKEGVLKVVGVNWILSGVAAGHRDFAVLGPRIKRSKSGARDEPLPHQRLKFHVLRVCSAALTFFWLHCFSGLLQKMFFICSGPINGLYTVVRSCRRDYLGH
jgi:hypothetical protein